MNNRISLTPPESEPDREAAGQSSKSTAGRMLIPKEAAHRYRDDEARLFRNILPTDSEKFSINITAVSR